MEDDDGDDLVVVIEGVQAEVSRLRKRLAQLERYLREEGYGDEDPAGPEDLDDD